MTSGLASRRRFPPPEPSIVQISNDIAKNGPGTPYPFRPFIHPTLDTLPVYVRGGSILPLQPLIQSTDETPSGPLELRVYPGQRRAAAHCISMTATLSATSTASFFARHSPASPMVIRCASTSARARELMRPGGRRCRGCDLRLAVGAGQCEAFQQRGSTPDVV